MMLLVLAAAATILLSAAIRLLDMTRLLWILEQGPSAYGVVGDDAVSGAWLGARSPLPHADEY
jgi:hypothetical protein